MRVHVFQHAEFEDLGSMRPWLEQRGADIRYTRFFAGETPPAVDAIDLLIAMGGPMSVNDEAELPWLCTEKRVVREAIARNVAVLGVCLGAQLIASALGARVFRNPVTEIGWFPIEAVGASPHTLRLPVESTVLHWHGETFDLPPGAVPLARSAATANQAFQFKRNVLGLQFHLETTPESALGMIEHCRGELVPGPFVQTEAELRAVDESRHGASNALMGGVLWYLLRDVARRGHASVVEKSKRPWRRIRRT